MKKYLEVLVLIMTLAFVGRQSQAQNGGEIARLDPALGAIVPDGG